MKRLGLLLLLIFVGLTVWYLFIKDYHYRVRFESRQPAGVLFYHISDWNAYRSEGIDSVRTISSRPFKGVTQKVYSGGSYSTFDWSIEAVSDSQSAPTYRRRHTPRRLVLARLHSVIDIRARLRQ